VGVGRHRRGGVWVRHGGKEDEKEKIEWYKQINDHLSGRKKKKGGMGGEVVK